MIFLAQELMGLRNLIASPGAEGKMAHDSRTNLFFPEDFSSKNPFVEFLSEFIKQRDISKETSNVQDSLKNFPEKTREDLIDFFMAKVDPDKMNSFPEIFTEKNILQPLESNNEFISTNNSENSYHEDITDNSVILEISNLEDNLNGTNTYKAEPSISNQTDIIALMRYLFSAEKDSQPLPQPELLSGADFLLKSTLNQTKKFIETKIDSRQNLHTLWQKLFLPKDDSQSHAHGQLNSDASFILKSVSTQTQAMVEKVENTSQEEYKPFSGHPPITKETGREVTPKISSAAATAIDADETFTAVKHQTKDTLPEENLRQLLNIITGESKNKAAPEILKSDMDLKTAFFSNPELKEDGHILRSITTNNMDFNLQTSKENTQSISSAFSQIQLSSNAMEGLNETNAHLKQIAAAFEKNPQRVENSVLGQIAARLFTGVRQGMGNMTINLYPPELGKVKVKIVSEKGSLNVHLHSQNHYVVGVLEKYLSMLQHSLENHGIALSDLQVSVESENQEGSQFENQRFWFGDENVTSRQSLSEENQQPSLSENNPGWTRLPQGLSLRV